jgi:DNA-directed RNA polymerase subunit H (RpoH/RPB5)
MTSPLSSHSSSKIVSIYKSRNTILELLESQQYNIDEYKSFNINEIDVMHANNQLDMLVLSKPSTDADNTQMRKVYVKYFLEQKQLRANNLQEIIDDLFLVENVLTKEDTIIIIVDGEPNEPLIKFVNELYQKEKIFVVIHNIKRLQFNILRHKLVPRAYILNSKETEEFMKRMNIKKLAQLPEISRFDPQAQAICLRPNQICRFTRESPTAMNYFYYRVCV